MHTPEDLRARLPELRDDTTAPDIALPGVGLAPFSDDLELPGKGRLAIRLVVRDDAPGTYVLDFRDSDRPRGPDAARFVVSPERVRTACTLAIAHALDTPATRALAARLSIACAPDSFVGGAPESSDPVGAAFTMARVWDTVQGALAHAWPRRVGAGSCSLGAIVTLHDGELTWIEVLPGGEGARPDRPGASAWPGPIVPPRTLTDGEGPEGLVLSTARRDDSGGGGARRGGDGLVRTYRCTRPLRIEVAIDRRTNPPHGIDRAGPPLGSEVFVERPGEPRRPVTPWRPFTLQPDETLVVATCGGAGHGFPGWGVDWDPEAWGF